MRCRGFSLIELMVTIAVLAILLAIGLPSFQGSMRSNRVATATNELIASINLARTEAIRNPNGAAMCASEDGEDCGGSWNDGWIVWISGDGDNDPDGDDDQVLRYVEGRGNLEVSAVSTGLGNTIRFDNRGRSSEARTLTVRSDVCPDGVELVRTLSLSRTGQVKVERGACTS